MILLLLIAAPICYIIFYWVVIAVRRMALRSESDDNGDDSRERSDTLDHIDTNGCHQACCYEMKCNRLSLKDEKWVGDFRRSSFKSKFS